MWYEAVGSDIARYPDTQTPDSIAVKMSGEPFVGLQENGVFECPRCLDA